MKFSVSSVWLGLPENIAADLLGRAIGCDLTSGAVLFEAGDPGDGFYRLDEGALKVTLQSPSGEERILAILGTNSIVGDLAIIDGQPRSATVIALSDCSLRYVSRSEFLSCAARHPELYRYLVKLLASRLRETDYTIEALAFLSARGRVAYALLEIADALGEKTNSHAVVIPNIIHQRDVAALAGVARENTNRILKEWERSKILTRLSRAYRINDQQKLEREMQWE